VWRAEFKVGYLNDVVEAEAMVFEQMMLRDRPGIHQRETANKVFLEERRLRSRSMVAVTVRCRLNGR